jgi:outer membrane protein assembly factor BamD (BamD/ComL family)
METIMNRKLFCLIFSGLILLCTSVSRGAASPFQNKELDQFFKGKALVFAGEWPTVRSAMETYLKDYPAGKMRDEALYWLAKSLDRLARDARDVVSAIDLKQKAFAFLDRLVKDFPDSLWRGDAKELQVTIAGGLAVLGVETYQKYLEDAVRSNAKNGIEIKMAALDSIIALDSKTAIPVLRNFLKMENDAGLRKHTVHLLGQKYTREVAAILEDAAKTDRDAEVRKEAGYWLDKIRIGLIPVQLIYYCYELRAADPSVQAKVPEGRVVQFTVPHGRPGSDSRAKRAIEQVFAGRIGFTGSMAAMSSDSFEQFDSMSRISHNIGGFNIELDAASITKTANDIAGRVRIGDMFMPFKVDGAQDVILAARRGDRQAVLYLEMAAKDIPLTVREEEKSSPAANLKPYSPGQEPVYSSEFHAMGIVIRSTRNSIDPDFQTTKLADFGQAKAEIPGSDGIWTLTGQLLLLNKERMLVGRMAKLVRPDGTTAATGEIRVPVGNPAVFKTGGGTELKFPTTFDLDNGGWIHSSRAQFGGGELAGDVIDFGPSQASLPGPRGIWTLTGRFVFLRGEQRIVARGAVLTDPQGITAARGELLIIPVKNPDKFTLESERRN